MKNALTWSRTLKVFLMVVVLGAIIAIAGYYITDPYIWSRSGALQKALLAMKSDQQSEQTFVAAAILESFLETRRDAAMWSGVYWGCTFAAALFSVLAATTLKLGTFSEKAELKKDLSAAFSMIATLLITISTSGDFQTKWQANRIAAARLEIVGYKFLESNGKQARSYFGKVGDILLSRNMAIVG